MIQNPSLRAKRSVAKQSQRLCDCFITLPFGTLRERFIRNDVCSGSRTYGSGLPRNGSGLPRDESGLPRDESGLPRDESGLPRDESGLPRDISH
jgi:hypothetical protein